MKKINKYSEDDCKPNPRIISQVIESQDTVRISQRKYNQLTTNLKRNFEINLWLDPNNPLNKVKNSLFMDIFSPTKLMTEILSPDELNNYKECYHRLSQFSHPTFAGLQPRLIMKKRFVKSGVIYNKIFG